MSSPAANLLRFIMYDRGSATTTYSTLGIKMHRIYRRRILGFVIVLFSFLVGNLRASACSCATRTVPDWSGNIRNATIIADYVVEKIRPTKSSYTKIGTLRVVKGWKGVQTGDAIDVRFGDETSCSSGVPNVGEKGSMASFIESTGWLYPPVCFGGQSRVIVEAFARERAEKEQQASIEPTNIAAQVALAADYNYWNEPKLAVRLLEKLASRLQDDAFVQFELAKSYASLGRIDDAYKARTRAWVEPRLHARISLLEPVIQQSRDRKLARSSLQSGAFVGSRTVATLSSSEMRDEDLSKTVLHDLTFVQPLSASMSDWTSSRLINLGFNGGNFSGANFSGSYVEKTDFNGGTLSGILAREFTCILCQFSGADLTHAIAPNASLYRVVLRRSNLARADLQGADLRGADFSNAGLENATMAGANLAGAIFTGASLLGASFENARLQGADIRGADLSGSDLKGANIAGARVDCGTKLPENVNVKAMRLIPMASCVGQAALSFSGDDFVGDYTNAYLAAADIDNPTRLPNFLGTNFEHATFRNLSPGSVLKMVQVNARDSSFEDFSGRSLSIADSDFSGSRIWGRDGQMPTVAFSRQSVRLDRAELRNVRIEIAGTEYVWPTPRQLFDTSLTGARIEQSVISCRMLTPDSVDRSGDKDQQDRERRRVASAFARDLAFAASLETHGVSNQFDGDCRQKMEMYLKDACRAGRKQLGIDYECPSAP